MVSVTSARPSGPRVEVPAKMTSSILPPRRVLAPCSPITQARASTTFDLPEPFGPTTQVTPVFEREGGRLCERLEPLEGQALQIHGAAFVSPANTGSTVPDGGMLPRLARWTSGRAVAAPISCGDGAAG